MRPVPLSNPHGSKAARPRPAARSPREPRGRRLCGARTSLVAERIAAGGERGLARAGGASGTGISGKGNER